MSNPTDHVEERTSQTARKALANWAFETGSSGEVAAARIASLTHLWSHIYPDHVRWLIDDQAMVEFHLLLTNVKVIKFLTPSGRFLLELCANLTTGPRTPGANLDLRMISSLDYTNRKVVLHALAEMLDLKFAYLGYQLPPGVEDDEADRPVKASDFVLEPE